jgi:hypothetical protein
MYLIDALLVLALILLGFFIAGVAADMPWSVREARVRNAHWWNDLVDRNDVLADEATEAGHTRRDWAYAWNGTPTPTIESDWHFARFRIQAWRLGKAMTACLWIERVLDRVDSGRTLAEVLNGHTRRRGFIRLLDSAMTAKPKTWR